jgi:hypothetical protein
MKDTKIMLAVVATFLSTWTMFSLIGWLLSDNVTLRNCYTDVGTILTMFMFGWIPSVIVANDLIKKLNQ